MNKYYANREIAVPFNLVYKLGYEKDSIENMDFLEDLFKGLLLEIDGRVTGDHLLLEKEVGSPLDMDYIEEEDSIIFRDLEDNKVIYDEVCELVVKKRLEALKTFGDAVELVYKMFYNSNQRDLEKLVQEFQRR